MLVELCSFNTCSTTGYGGAIYFYDQGQCVLSSVCGVKCNTENQGYGQFCYVYVSLENSNKNHILDSSITLTEKKYKYQYYTLYHERGDVLCKGVNVSNNEVYYASGIYIGLPLDSSILFSSFRNNKATGSDGNICIECSLNTHYITNTNIIENEQTSSRNGIINSQYTTITMTHCSISGNKPGSGVVFYGSFICDNCSIGSDQNGTFYPINTATESFINSYQYLVLGSCKTEMNCLEEKRTKLTFSYYIVKCLFRFFSILVLSYHK